MITALVRTLILYVVVIIVMRIMGKRQLGELEPAELVVTILISELAAVPMQDPGIPILSGMVVPILTLLSLQMLITSLIMKNQKFRTIMCGKPGMLISEGKVLEAGLQKCRLTTDELIEELRIKNITDLSQVKYAIAETSGKLSAVLYARAKPPGTADMGLPVSENGLPVILINDGRLLSDNLRLRSLNQDWLVQKLRERGEAGVKDVFLMSVDEGGNIYFVKKEKRP